MPPQLKNPLTSLPIVALSRSISLTYEGFICLNRESWQEEHFEFFAENAGTCCCSLMRQASFAPKDRKSRTFLRDDESWLFSQIHEKPIGWAQLQILEGDFRHGVLVVGFSDWLQSESLVSLMSQLFSSIFISRRLDSLKILPTNAHSKDFLDGFMSDFRRSIKTFVKGYFSILCEAHSFQADKEEWLKSQLGFESLTKLAWLQRRVERLSSSQAQASEKKRPWLLGLLSFRFIGRRRGERLTHPLDRIRRERTHDY